MSKEWAAAAHAYQAALEGKDLTVLDPSGVASPDRCQEKRFLDENTLLRRPALESAIIEHLRASSNVSVATTQVDVCDYRKAENHD